MNLRYILIAIFLAFCLISNVQAVDPRTDAAERLKEMRERIRSHRAPGEDITKDFEQKTMAAAGKNDRQPPRETTEKMIRDINERREKLKRGI